MWRKRAWPCLFSDALQVRAFSLCNAAFQFLHRRPYSAGSWDKKTASKYRPRVPQYSPKTLAKLHPNKRFNTKFSARKLARMNPVEPEIRRPIPRFHTGKMYPADPFKEFRKPKPRPRPPEEKIPNEVYEKIKIHGVVIQRYIPLAHKVFHELAALEEGVRRLMKVIPVKRCTMCMEVHVGTAGHRILTCLPQKQETLVRHRWIRAYPEDVLISIKAYHVYDKLRPNLEHRHRYASPRLSAIRELCLHAGVNDPKFPMMRFPGSQTQACQDADSSSEEDEADKQVNGNKEQGLDAAFENSKVRGTSDTRKRLNDKPGIKSDQDVKEIAERTLVAFEFVRRGVKKLMGKYRVWSCGYCPEVHVGYMGHSVKCVERRGAGSHFWQKATLSDIFPPNFVWHVPSGAQPTLHSDLKYYYGQAPAVVELCVQAGAEPPQVWKPHMRTDIIIPDVEEEALAA